MEESYVYVLVAYTTFYDFVDQNETTTLGIFSTREAAENALMAISDVDPREFFWQVDKWEFVIERYDLDPTTIFDREVRK